MNRRRLLGCLLSVGGVALLLATAYLRTLWNKPGLDVVLAGAGGALAFLGAAMNATVVRGERDDGMGSGHRRQTGSEGGPW